MFLFPLIFREISYVSLVFSVVMCLEFGIVLVSQNVLRPSTEGISNFETPKSSESFHVLFRIYFSNTAEADLSKRKSSYEVVLAFKHDFS